MVRGILEGINLQARKLHSAPLKISLGSCLLLSPLQKAWVVNCNDPLAPRFSPAIEQPLTEATYLKLAPQSWALSCRPMAGALFPAAMPGAGQWTALLGPMQTSLTL